MGQVKFNFDNHILDIDRRELRRGADLVAMQPQVFDLLVHLLTHRDRVVSRDDLIALVWGGRIVSDSTLDSRINAARNAVGDNGNGANAQDLSNPQIAEKLVVSRRTVDAHLRSIYDKLGVKSRDAAIRVAREQRLIS